MSIATFGNKVFNVSSDKIYTFDDFNSSSSLNIDEQEVDKQKPSTYIKGPGLDEVKFSIPLVRQKNIDIRKEYEDWVAIKDKADPQMLIIGNKPFSKNRFLLVNVALPETQFDKNGNLIKAKIELQFKEFVRHGKKQETAGTKKGSKNSKKRDNPNVVLSEADSAKLDELEKQIFGG